MLSALLFSARGTLVPTLAATLLVSTLRAQGAPAAQFRSIQPLEVHHAEIIGAFDVDGDGVVDVLQ